MTQQELLDLLALHKGDADSAWAARVVFERQNGLLHELELEAASSTNLLRVGIQLMGQTPPDIPGSDVQFGGAAHLEIGRGVVGGPASLAYAAFQTYASETHEAPDTAAGAGGVAVAGTAAITEAPDTAAGTG